MNFDEYQQYTEKTAIYPEAGMGSPLSLAYVGLGLGESGEIQNQLKKVLRDDEGVVSEQRRKDLLKEAGDVLWYLARLADELEASLDDVAQANIDKLMDRKERGVIVGSGDNR